MASVERLESRVLLSAFTVTNVNDSGPGSLRQAIADSNSAGGPQNQIVFNIPAQGTPVISLLSQLPLVQVPCIINATTQVGTRIVLNGSNAGPNASGFMVSAGNSAIEGFVIQDFSYDGIDLMAGGGNLIRDNLIGTDFTGSSAQPNGRYGILINGSPNNSIGAPGGLNVISGNGNAGIAILNLSAGGGFATGNIIQDNYVGVTAGGTVALPNYQGILVSTPGNRIGVPGPFSAVGNVISGNTTDGIVIQQSLGGVAPNRNFIENNYIGTDVTGSTAVHNGGFGIHVSSAGLTTIGSNTANSGNVISGNGAGGISLDSGTTMTIVMGNLIGVSPAGGAVANVGAGILVVGNNNAIGGPGGGLNVISGNALDGIDLTGQATGNIISGNFIGADPTGKSAAPNQRDGILLNASGGNAIGVNGAGNVISGNGANGVLLQDQSNNNTVAYNMIGLDVSGSSVIPNGSDGVLIDNSQSNTIGFTTAAHNVISFNDANGVEIRDQSTGNLVMGNFIGTDATGTVTLGNNLDGVLIDQSPLNTIGGATSGTGNVISASNVNGVEIRDNSANNKVLGNFIGTDASGAQPLGNFDDGVLVTQSQGVQIGGTVAGDANHISYNRLDGIGLGASGLSTTQAAVLGNFIESNHRSGIDINPGNNNQIGAPSAGNDIGGNGLCGVEVDQGTGNAIRFNAIHDNAGQGIGLGGNKVVPNSQFSPRPGPNDLQNYPIITKFTSNASFAGTFHSLANTTFFIDLYHGTNLPIQGTGYIASQTVTTDQFGNANFAIQVLNINQQVGLFTATATVDTNALYGDTSEFMSPAFYNPPGIVIGVTPTITGFVFNDGNFDTLPDPGDVPLPGVTVIAETVLPGTSGPTVFTTMTDSQGLYTFSNLPLGQYTVQEVVPPGFARTAPLSATTGVNVADQSVYAGPTFGNVQVSTVTLNFNYLVLIAQNYNQPGTFANGDLNGDGTVDFADLVLLAQNYNQTLPPVGTATVAVFASAQIVSGGSSSPAAAGTSAATAFDVTPSRHRPVTHTFSGHRLTLLDGRF